MRATAVQTGVCATHEIDHDLIRGRSIAASEQVYMLRIQVVGGAGEWATELIDIARAENIQVVKTWAIEPLARNDFGQQPGRLIDAPHARKHYLYREAPWWRENLQVKANAVLEGRAAFRDGWRWKKDFNTSV